MFSSFVSLGVMKFKQKFSESDLGRIRDAVKKAEDKISGEIVPVIVEQSGNYPIAHYKSALFFGIAAFASIVILDRYVFESPATTLFYDPLFMLFIVVVCGVVGWLLPGFFSSYKRALLHRSFLDDATRQRAENAFLEEEVFNTRHRTGIMIFISLFEHEVIVMADKGISKVVEQKEWDNLVAELIGHIRRGAFVEGLEAGVKRCGELLLEKGFVKSDDDVNELGDDLRIS